MINNSSKMCFLILAHNDIKILKKLIKSLDYESFDIYVHIDKKSQMEENQFRDLNLKYSNIYFIKDRISVYWGDISIVYATLKMYKLAISNYKYERFITLSGNDYPIKSNKDIFEILSNKNIEFIMGNKLPQQEEYRVKNYFYFKLPRLSRKCLNILSKVFLKNKKNFVTIDNKRMDIFFAPQWHALTYECVSYFLTIIKDNDSIIKYFKHSFAPDELLIPTIIFNSPFKEKTLGWNLDNVHYNKKNATHFLNYNPKIEIFDESKFDIITMSNKLFFRKVRSGISDKLIEEIDMQRIN